MSNVMRSNEGEDGENRCSVDELRQGPSGGGSSNHINMDLVTDVELHEDYDMITTSTSKGLKGDLAGAVGCLLYSEPRSACLGGEGG